MILETKIRNAISLGGFLLGLAGIAYSLWVLIAESDLQVITLFLPSISFIAGASYLLIRDNDQYPRGIDTEVRNITLFLFAMAMFSGFVFMGHTYATYFAGLAIFMMILFFATIYEKFWSRRIR